MDTFTVSIKGSIVSIDAEHVSDVAIIAAREHGARTCDVAVLACEPSGEPTVDECLMPKGAIRYA